MFKVHVGYTKTGKNRWIRFATVEKAQAFCSEVFEKLNIVLLIIKE
jgi:hypothetical protein